MRTLPPGAPPLPPLPLPAAQGAQFNTVQMHRYAIDFGLAVADSAQSDLEAENKRLRGALTDIKYGLEGARIWGGMEWAYNPLHPFKYLPLIAKAETALKEQP